MMPNPLQLNEVPEGWLKAKLADASFLIKDGTHGTHPRLETGIPLLSAKNITEDGRVFWNDDDSRISQAEYDTIHRTYTLQPDDLLITVVGSLGRRALVPDSVLFTIQRSVAIVRPDISILLPRYLYHFAASDYFQRQLVVRSNATAQAGVYLHELADIEVAIPSQLEQHAIAAILDTIDAAIQQTDALIAKLRQMKAGLLHDLLTRGLDENGELRDPVAHPEQFKDSPMGRIPREWDVVRVEQVGAKTPYAIVDGPFGSNLKSEHYREHGIPVIQSGFVTAGVFMAESYVYVDQALFHAQKRSAVHPGDIVMAKIGAQCGTCAILPTDHPVGILAGNSLKISTDHAVCRTHYLLRVLHYYYDMGRIDLIKTETAQPAISLKSLRSLLLALPNLAEQDAIVSCLNVYDTRIHSEEATRDKLALLKRGLMDDLLTGRVRVNTSLIEKEYKP